MSDITAVSEARPAARVDHAAAVWAFAVVGAIWAVLVVGGITRLTRSGLSIVEWHPIIGTLPPLTDAAWDAAFARYRETPEFRTVHAWMSLADFKGIFFWEYLHRLLARSVGLVVVLPLAWLAWKRRFPKRFIARAAVGFGLGGLQGALGWFMVKSGLVDVPHVSHYRLAAHLVLAIFIMGFFTWFGLDLLDDARGGRSRQAAPALVRRASLALIVVVFLQLAWGAFTAGKHAGLGYNTFPTMNGAFLPDEAWAISPAWHNPLENPAAIQFVHRMLGWTVLLSSFAMAWAWRRIPRVGKYARMLAAAATAQFLLGVATLLAFVPIVLASLHQAVACTVVLAAVALVRETRRSRAQGSLDSAI